MHRDAYRGRSVSSLNTHTIAAARATQPMPTANNRPPNRFHQHAHTANLHAMRRVIDWFRRVIRDERDWLAERDRRKLARDDD